MKEPDVTTYTKKYRAMEESRLKEGLFPFRDTVDISFLLDYLKTYQSMVCQAFQKQKRNDNAYNGMV